MATTPTTQHQAPASAAAATTAKSNPSVWFQLCYKDEDKEKWKGKSRVYKSEIDGEGKEWDIDALISRVKHHSLKVELEHCGVTQIKFYHHGTTSFSENNAMDPGNVVPPGTTTTNPLIVVAPAPPPIPKQADGTSKKCFRFDLFPSFLVEFIQIVLR